MLHIPPSEMRGQPGTRAPHVALGPDRSTLDLFGRAFVLLRPAGRRRLGAAGVDAHLIDADGFTEAYGISRGGRGARAPGRDRRLALRAGRSSATSWRLRWPRSARRGDA